MIPRRSARDYLVHLQHLLPRGLAWTRALGARLTGLLHGSAEELARLDGEVHRLLDEILPSTTVDGLSDWERVLGLPDACTGPEETFAQRRAAVLQKLVRPVGQNAAYFIMLAKTLGYEEAEVVTFPPFRVEVSGAEDALNDAPGGAIWDADGEAQPDHWHGWDYAWLLSVSGQPVREFKVEESGAEDRLREWGDSRLECVINRAKPAHTVALFGYEQ